MYGRFGFADSPSPCVMIRLSAGTVRALWIGCSAGTYFETPPFPWSPWHAEQANWTNRCAPIATWGLTAVRAPADDGLPPAGPVVSRTTAVTRAAITRTGARRRKASVWRIETPERKG